MMQLKRLLTVLNRSLLPILLASSLVGCSTSGTIFESSVAVAEDTSLVCRVPYDFPTLPTINMRDVKFYTITPEVMKEILNGNPDDMPEVFIALSTEDYEKLSYNMLDIIQYMESNKTLLKEIRMYYSKGSEVKSSDTD